MKAKNLFKNRVNIFDKIAFGISLIPIFTMLTMFTQFFRNGLIVNGTNFADETLFAAIWDVTLDFFKLLILIRNYPILSYHPPCCLIPFKEESHISQTMIHTAFAM